MNLSDVFIDAWSGQQVPDAFAETLTRAHISAAERWPALSVSNVQFIRYVAERAPSDVPAGEALEGLHLADLYLACGCCHGESTALQTFDQHHLSRISDFLRRIDGSPWFLDEIRQLLRSHLLIAEPGATPRIGKYSGRGPLSSWVGITAQRMALTLVRRVRGPHYAFESETVADVSTGADPELDYLKLRYRDDFRGAFCDAMAALPLRDRMLLRLYLLEHASHEQIAKMYDVNQSTVTRWIAQVRSNLLKETQRIVCERLQLDTREFQSLAQIVQSQLNLSLTQLLGETAS